MKNFYYYIKRLTYFLMALLLLVLLLLCEQASTASFPDPFVADPPMPLLSSSHLCQRVELFDDAFSDFRTKDFSFSLAEKCLMDVKNTRLLLSVEVNVTEGRQFDRSCYIEIGGAIVFAGTTQEPEQKIAPSWLVTADITEYFALLRAGNNSGTVSLANGVTSFYNGMIYGKAHVSIYIAPTISKHAPPDYVIPLGTASSSKLSASLSPADLPSFASSAYISFQAQGQQGDEFWWSCVPTNESEALGSCGGTAYRNIAITIGGDSLLFPVMP